ncbi:MAG TPA: amidohydrolase family protein [Actinomycetes bacterium]|jgi:imidazolonepropionase-like amidohydrolase|nr:amidohydrolase family protein [Actinomycetes bacterium]
MGRPALTLWGARLIDGRGRKVRERASVTIAGGRITEVADATGERPPDGAVDLGGRTLLPGLIDAHVHLSSDVARSPGFGPPPPRKGEPPRPRALGYFVLANSAQAFLRAGITTVRDVGSYDDEALVLREAIRLGLLDGPRVLSCGRILSATAPGGRVFATMYREADGPDELRKAVREQLRRGADFVKVMATGARSVLGEDPEPAQLTRPELRAVVEEAHRMGRRVAAHAEGLGGARLAVEEGVDTIEHGLSLHRAPELLERMAERGIVLVPTLSTFHDLAERFADEFSPVLVAQAKRQREEAYRTLAAARRAGVVLAMGHDSGPPGDDAVELVRMVEGGLSPVEAIAAATSGAAQALGLQDDAGVVAAGRVADLVVVDGDPLADIGVLTDPASLWLVLLAGRPVAGRAVEGGEDGGLARWTRDLGSAATPPAPTMSSWPKP